MKDSKKTELLKNKEKAMLLRDVLYDYNNNSGRDFSKKLIKSIEKLQSLKSKGWEGE